MIHQVSEDKDRLQVSDIHIMYDILCMYTHDIIMKLHGNA